MVFEKTIPIPEGARTISFAYDGELTGSGAEDQHPTTSGSLHPDHEIRNRVYKAVEKDLLESYRLLFCWF